VRLMLRVLLGTLVVATLGLSGCATANSGNSISYEPYTYTCCGASGTQRTWHPGDTYTLQWIVEAAGSTTDSTGQRVTLSAVLTGPYQSITTLKAGGAALMTLRATPIAITDRIHENPVSTIVLPVNLPAGYYNVADRMEFAGGGAVGSGRIIQVAPASG
jgi:hypothetical protein